jgi:hypothetical protein
VTGIELDEAIERAEKALDGARCPGTDTNGALGQPGSHCAECCFGTGFLAASEEDLELLKAFEALLTTAQFLRERVTILAGAVLVYGRKELEDQLVALLRDAAMTCLKGLKEKEHETSDLKT